MRRRLDFYLSSMKIAVLSQIQYRAQNYFYMIGMIAEPVIYLVVWSSVAEQQGGQSAGTRRAPLPPITSSGLWCAT
jgi:ABC-2 type transport system permease protein